MINPTMRECFNTLIFESPNTQAYAIIDGAAALGLPAMLTADQSQNSCLYLGELSPELNATAPYLIALKPYGRVHEWLLNQWGQHQCIYAIVSSQVDFEAVYKHFRSLLIITNSDNNKSIYFRYYDPRTLRRFLTCASQNQARKLFGPVQFYLLENSQIDPEDNTIERYWEEDTGVQHTPLISPPQIYFNSPFKTIDHTLSPEEIDWQTQHTQTHQRLIKQAKKQGTTKGQLRISLALMEQQRLQKENDFVQWYIDDFMPDNFPEATQEYARKELSEMIKNARNQAIQQRFLTPEYQVQFVTLMWQIGANFYQFSGFKEIINNPRPSELKNSIK
jgi:hypothetical protein